MYTLNAKHVLLTYSQSGELGSPDTVLAKFTTNEHLTIKLVYVVVGKELHRDGGIHYHIALGFDKKYH